MSSNKFSERLTQQLNPFRKKKSPLLQYNPADSGLKRPDAEQVDITVFDYDEKSCKEYKLAKVEDAFRFIDPAKKSWINISGLRKKQVEAITSHYDIHWLITEDILSIGQRAKTDEMGDTIFSLIPMLFLNGEQCVVEQEQVSLVLGKNFVISFQEDPSRDNFNPIRERLHINGSRIRTSGADYLFYTLVDIIVDNYFSVMEKLGEQIEALEDEVTQQTNNKVLSAINHLRREVSMLRRTILPVRELVNGLMKSESGLIAKRTQKYIKDVYDHIVQATEMADGYRDMVMTLQDLYLNHVNLKMNEVMKVLAVVTTLMAPMTVIAGIYGMNFVNMPELHTHDGYYVVLCVMTLIFIIMVYIFRRRGWF